MKNSCHLAIITTGLLGASAMSYAQDDARSPQFESGGEVQDFIPPTDLDRPSAVLACVVKLQSRPNPMLGNSVYYTLHALSSTPLSAFTINGVTTAIEPGTISYAREFILTPIKAGPLKLNVSVSNGRSTKTCTAAHVTIAPTPTCKPGQYPVQESHVLSYKAIRTIIETVQSTELNTRCVMR